ncbi:unnamed protein product [Durusdinium trenchii]|uniref:DNA helicase n=1 Tax=Durusdinium trenchii TaxID=1381693 RepID=A0ABP0K883_9DINO
MAVPRVVGAACSRTDVGNGEENARYKLTLFGLMRCPGVGACADPVSLAAAYVCSQQTQDIRFSPAWRLRRAEVEVLATEADRKIRIAKKLPTLADTTTFRCLEGKGFTWCHILVSQALYHGHNKHVCVGTQNFQKLVVCISAYLAPVADTFAAEQLHLAEFVAHRTRDMVFRLDMHTEARNTAIQIAKDKTTASVEDDTASVRSDDQQIMVEIENVGGEPDAVEDDRVGEANVERPMAGGIELMTLLPQDCYDPDAVRAHLLHVSELESAKQRGTRTSDAVRFMLEVEKALNTKVALCHEHFPVEDSGGWMPQASVELLLSAQQQRVEFYRKMDSADDAAEEATVAVAHAEEEAVVRLVAADLRLRGPAAVAKVLADRATLNRDQLGFVAIVAKILQDAFESLPPSGDGMLAKDRVLLRCLLVGGGGCGKTRIINMVLRPLFEAVFGDGSMQALAPSNKAARQIHGRTMHSANKLRKDSSLRTVHLRVSAETRKALECNTVPLAAIVIDEFSQCIGQMLHADALRKSYGRQRALGLELHRYAELDESWGRMPVVVISGDELQLPPVPFSHSLLASVDGTSDEHKAGVHLFGQFRYVYRLQTAMRFQDPVLECILRKMRTPGGALLTQSEWQALVNTNISGSGDSARLSGTEHFFQACYTWSVVSMAYTIRSFESAKAAGKTLYATRAVDMIQNLQADKAAAIARAVVAHPNMNETGRLPHYGLYHVGMEVRFTQTVAAPHVVVDTIGIIRGFAFASEDRSRTDLHASFVVLRRFPEAIYVELQDVPQKFLPDEACLEHTPHMDAECAACLRMRGVFLVRPFTNQQGWSLKVTIPGSLATGTEEEISVKIRRTQIPLVTVKASTLHVLQGTTTDPGLIFHWRFPRRLQADMRWLAAYVALSRVRSLDRLRSVGLDNKNRAILEQGPPNTLPAAARHGRFVVQVKFQKVEEYTYTRQGAPTKGKRLHVLFASAEEGAYVSGRMVMWQQKSGELEAAAARFQVGLHFEMKSVVFLQKEVAEYIHTPLKVVLDLRQTHFDSVLQGQFPNFCLGPPTRLKDILELTDGRQRFDITSLVRLRGDPRTVTTRQGQRVAQDVVLRDESCVQDGHRAEITTSIFAESQAKLEEFIALVNLEKPLTFFGFDVQVRGAEIKVTPSFQDFRCEVAVSVRAAAQDERQNEIWKEAGQTLTHEWQPSVSTDYTSKEGFLSFCALLDAYSQQDAAALHGKLFQLNNIHVPYPPEHHTVERRVFWSTRIRDCSGSLEVAIRQKAACQLAKIDTADHENAVMEFNSQHGGDLLSWPLLASVKILVTLRGDNDSGATQATDSVSTTSSSKRMRFLVVEASEQDLQATPTKAVLAVVHALSHVPCSGDAFAAALLSQLTKNSFGVFQVQPEVVVAHLETGALERHAKRRRVTCAKALVMLLSKERTQQEALGSDSYGIRLVTKNVRDALAPDAGPVTVVAYCQRHALKDFILDPPRTGTKTQYALALISDLSTTSSETTYVVEQLQLLQEGDAEAAMICLRRLEQLTALIASRQQTSDPLPAWTDTLAESASRIACPRISAYPAGDTWESPVKASQEVPFTAADTPGTG